MLERHPSNPSFSVHLIQPSSEVEDEASMQSELQCSSGFCSAVGNAEQHGWITGWGEEAVVHLSTLLRKSYNTQQGQAHAVSLCVFLQTSAKEEGRLNLFSFFCPFVNFHVMQINFPWSINTLSFPHTSFPSDRSMCLDENWLWHVDSSMPGEA